MPIGMIQSVDSGRMRPNTLWMRVAFPVAISIRTRRPRRVAPTERSASKLPQMGAEQHAAARLGERGVERLLAVHRHVEHVRASGEQEHAVVDRGREGVEMAVDLAEPHRPAEDAREVGRGGRARARTEGDEVQRDRRQEKPPERPPERQRHPCECRHQRAAAALALAEPYRRQRLAHSVTRFGDCAHGRGILPGGAGEANCRQPRKARPRRKRDARRKQPGHHPHRPRAPALLDHERLEPVLDALQAVLRERAVR